MVDIEETDATATASEDDDDDDLDAPLRTSRQPTARDDNTDQPNLPEKEPPRSISPDPLKVQISDPSDGDEDFDDPEAAYKAFQKRKSLKRKRASTGPRKSTTHTSTPRVTSTTFDVIVGKIPRSRRKAPVRPLKTFGEVPSDDEGDDSLPDYLQKRRTEFDTKTEELKTSGLKLPPTYDDVEFSDDERLEDLREKPTFSNMTPCSPYKDITLPYSLGLIPAPIAQWLRQYQVDGVAFLHELFVYQKGGILGDDMGLGKTVQVIAFLTAAYGKTGDERDAKRMRKMRRSDQPRWYPRTLIVCPGTLLQNWRSEFERWGWWHVDLYHGDSKELALQAARSGRIEILITTYGTYLNNKDAINMVDWDCVIADECHVIKQKSSMTTKEMNGVNALCRIGLTGTAIQNNYEELWTLLNWTNPGILGSALEWRKSVSEPLKIGQSHDATVQQLSKARKTAKMLVENLLPQFFLRRMKTLIADQLPKKIDRVVFCPLTDTQADAYENILDSEVIEYIKHSTDMCDCRSGKKAGWCCRRVIPGKGPWAAHVFPAIAVLQKLSNHLATLIPQGADSNEKREKDKEWLEIAVPSQWEQLYRQRDSILNYANSDFCGKWKVLKQLLKWWHANGDKVLVFSHSVRLLRMLQMLFNHTSYNVSYLDGSMNYDERAQAVADFNSDPRQFVFLISTRSGGVGLNITSANKVVVVDPNWNPSHDLQAQDRAYRIGQSRDVEVFRLISAGTIEEIVYARQIYKQQQANIGYNASSERRYFKGVQEKKDQKGEIFGLKNLFEYQNNNVVLRDIVNKTNVAESRAGVHVMGIEVDQSHHDNPPTTSLTTTTDDSDEVMNHLAAIIRGEKEDPDDLTTTTTTTTTPKKHQHDPIQAILASAGVEYTHLNNEVIGTSKEEEHLSRRAQQADHHTLALDDPVFAADSQTDDGATIPYKYHPPRDVMKRQFCSMAREFGFPSATEFALVVEGMTPAQRTACLERWYRVRREVLLGG
ncbi:DNA excision repair protein [Aspergillus taichungensis]|uniref:DNA excision repair protein n=1 Tax=Aspergillus taichungensis TaxID=482145 RepID=A0A2J5I8S5_9EURO|nr:DNA excision repair protein [Aspergillus taichungensis]